MGTPTDMGKMIEQTFQAIKQKAEKKTDSASTRAVASRTPSKPVDTDPDVVSQEEELKAHDEAQEKRQRKARQARYEKRLADIPRRYRSYRMADCEDRYAGADAKADAYHAAEAFAADTPGIGESTCLVLAGGFGVGKTVLATALYKRLLWRLDVDGLWRRWYQAVNDIQAAYDSGVDRDPTQVLAKYQDAEVLLLDDVGDLELAEGEGRPSKDRRRLFYEIIDHRHAWMRPTIITTNLAGETTLAEHWGQRTYERMMEMSYMVQMAGENYRLSE